MGKNEWLVDKLQSLDDEGFIEVMGAVTEKAAKTEHKPKDELVHITEIQDEIEEASKDWGKLVGLSTGYQSLDEKIGGLEDGHVILIGGETSNGKSALAANIARNIAKRGDGVLFITLEMLQKDIGARLNHINGGTVDDLNLMFQKEYRIDYKDLEPLMNQGRDMGDVKLVVLDYMQYLGRGMTNNEVAKMSKEFKSLALKYEVPFLVIVSLRKSEAGVKKRKWTDIEIEEFMGTGAIGYDCDVAMITSRKDPDNEFVEDKIYVKILKTRNTAINYDDRILELDWDKTRITESKDNWVTPVARAVEKSS